MRILNVSYNAVGGAGILVARTHKRLLELGYDSHLFLRVGSEGHFQSHLIGIQPTVPKRSLSDKIRSAKNRFFQLFRARPDNEAQLKAIAEKEKNYCFYSDSEFSELNCDNLLNFVKDGDVVLIYWLGYGSMNSTNIRQIARKKKIKLIWYGLDHSPVTGGCHYFWDCKRFETDCNDCPALAAGNDLAKKQLAVKKDNLKDLNISFMASSDIAVSNFLSASLKFKAYHTMPYAIDPEIFRLGPGADDNSIFKIFFNAQNIYDVRKGWKYFKEFVNHLDSLLVEHDLPISVELMSVDPGNHSKELGELKKVKVLATPAAKGDEELAKLYQNSHALICTSIEDLSPLMVNEALLCGIPVIGFKNASNPEYIVNGKNGWLTSSVSGVELGEVVYRVLQGELKFDSPEWIRKSILPIHEVSGWNLKFSEILSNTELTDVIEA